MSGKFCNFVGNNRKLEAYEDKENDGDADAAGDAGIMQTAL